MNERFDEDFYRRNLNPEVWFLQSDEKREELNDSLRALEEHAAELGLTEDDIVGILHEQSVLRDRPDFVDAVMDDIESLPESEE